MAKKYSLGVKNRIMLVQYLPQEGSFSKLKTIEKLERELLVDEEEMKQIDYTQLWLCQDCQNQIKSITPPTCKCKSVDTRNIGFWWDQKKEVAKEIEIGEFAEQWIISQLTKLEKAEKLPKQHIPLYEIFIEENKPAI